MVRGQVIVPNEIGDARTWGLLTHLTAHTLFPSHIPVICILSSMTDEEAATDGYHPYTEIEFVCQICTRKCNIGYTCLQICTRNGVFGYIRRGKRRGPDPTWWMRKRRAVGWYLTHLTDYTAYLPTTLLYLEFAHNASNICIKHKTFA